MSPDSGTGDSSADPPSAGGLSAPSFPLSVTAEPGEHSFQPLIESLPVGFYRSTPEGRCIEANAALARMLGYADVEALRQIDLSELYLRRQDRATRLERIDARTADYEELELKTSDGRRIWVRDFPRAVRDREGRLLFIEGMLVDVSELKDREAELKRSEREYRQLFEKAHDAIIIFRIEDERILEVNDSACRLYGFSRKEFLGLSLESLSKDVRRGKERIERFLRHEDRSFETAHFRKDGSELKLEINAALVSYKGRKAIMSINHDITERTRHLEDLKRLALVDTLTGIPNRLLFEDHLALALAQAGHNNAPFAVLFLDLDGFKEVNDSLGHAAGDDILREVAKRLSSALRSGDTVARYGGDEFVILLPELAAADDAERVADKILEIVRIETRTPTGIFSVHVSVGVALYPEAGRTGEELVIAADRAMYMAKVSGKGVWRRAPRSGA
jgi:diguanylate cyclase (GGDEF)-like protein/PAS domain S-box-containing protein